MTQDAKVIQEIQNQQHNTNGKGFGNKESNTNNPNNSANSSNSSSNTTNRKSVADSMNLTDTELKLVELTSDLKAKQMLSLVDRETLRKFGLGLQESNPRILQSIVSQLEALNSIEFDFNPDDAEFLLAGQPITTNLLGAAK